MVSTLPAMLCTACFSGGCNMLQHYVQRGLETWFLTCSATLSTAYFSGGGYTLQHYVQRGLKTWCNIAHNIARSTFQYTRYTLQTLPATLCAVEEATRLNVKCHEDWKHGTPYSLLFSPPPPPSPHRRFRVVSVSNTHLTVK